METSTTDMLGTRPWLSPQALAVMLDVPVQTIYAWRSRGDGPPAHKVGRHLRFSPAEVEVWLAARRQEEARR